MGIPSGLYFLFAGPGLLVVVASGIVTFLAMFAHYARRMCRAMEARR